MNLSGLWTAPFPSGPSNDWPGNEPILYSSLSTANLVDISDDGYNRFGDSSDHDTPIEREGSTGIPMQVVARTRNKPIPRKGHTKSRKGCYGCKKRKIKCQETRPTCGNCQKAEINCEYPKTPQQPALIPSPMLPLQSTPVVFTMADMKLFHYFMVRAYPHLPVGADSVWTLEIPAFAHQYEYLLRSMLALGASHLTMSSSSLSELESRALSHRVVAIKSLNKALSRPATSKEEADARFATFMNLTFQSTCMKDGLADFLTMLRGCMLQGDLSGESAFACFREENHLETMNDKFSEATFVEIAKDDLDGGSASLAALESMCQTDVERRYHRLLTDLIANAHTSPRAAYASFISSYNFVGLISHSDFQQFIDPTNKTMQLLLSHFLASHVLLRHISIYENLSRNAIPMYRVLSNWCEKINNGLDPPLRKFGQWPMSFVLRTDIFAEPPQQVSPWMKIGRS